MSDECEEGDTTVIHGDHDKYGIGKAISSVCGLLVVVVIALACTHNLDDVLLGLFGG